MVYGPAWCHVRLELVLLGCIVPALCCHERGWPQSVQELQKIRLLVEFTLGTHVELQHAIITVFAFVVH